MLEPSQKKKKKSSFCSQISKKVWAGTGKLVKISLVEISEKLKNAKMYKYYIVHRM